MKKRGIGHIEAILSFVLFVGFLVFAFFFFSPFSGNRVLDSSLVYTFNEITDNVSVEIESYSVVLDGLSADLSIVRIPSPSNLEGVSVQDSSGTVLNSGFSSGEVTFDRSGNDFVVLIFSEDLVSGDLSGGDLLGRENYSVSSSEIKDIYSESRILALNQSYHADYLALKQEFNIPNRVDFSFLVDLDDYVIRSEREIPESLEVISDQERVEIMRLNGKVNFVDLFVRVW